MYVFVTDSFAQTLDPILATELRNALNRHDIFELAIDDGLQNIINAPHHLPCLTHVIQLSVNAFLQELKIGAKNDDVVNIQWNEEDKELKEKGLLRTLEKVSYYKIVS